VREIEIHKMHQTIRVNKMIRYRYTLIKKHIPSVSNEDIKYPEKIGNLMIPE